MESLLQVAQQSAGGPVGCWASSSGCRAPLSGAKYQQARSRLLHLVSWQNPHDASGPPKAVLFFFVPTFRLLAAIVAAILPHHDAQVERMCLREVDRHFILAERDREQVPLIRSRRSRSTPRDSF